MTRAVTPKLEGTILVAAVALWLALLTGRVELVAVAALPALAAATGLAGAGRSEVLVDVSSDADRCLEGDTVVVTVAIASEGAVPDLRVALIVPSGFEPSEGSDVTLSLGSEGSTSFEVPLRAVHWGVHDAGTVAVRILGPGGYVVWERVHHRTLPIRVFPYLERVGRGIAPTETQVHAGNYVSRAAGDGIEFAHVRPFHPGDRVRSVNWRVTTRRQELHVNVFHPERNADVIVFLDTFGNFGHGEDGSLEMAVRGAAGVVRHYLAHNDRVGVVAFGGDVRWLTASMGRTQIYRIVDVLLASRALFSYAWKGIEHLPRNTLPPSALVIAFSPLIDARATAALADLATRDFPLVVVDTLPEDSVEPQPSAEGDLAHRVWRLERAALRGGFASLGVPVVPWHSPGGLDAVLATVPRSPRVRT
jgi:uncharacterized protein (DUF58 family)